MNDIDLIPADFRRRIGLRHQIRRLVLACILIAATGAAGRAGIGYLIWHEQAEVVRMEEQRRELERNQNQVQSMLQQREVTEQQLAALDSLRGRDRVAKFLRAIDAAYSGRIWLDSVHFARRGEAATEADQPATAVSLGADLYGHAMSHSELAVFMQKLGAQSTVADVRLIDTATRTYTTSQVIDFNLALQMRSPVTP
jgi:Fimbrial assembly protein (PilN)